MFASLEKDSSSRAAGLTLICSVTFVLIALMTFGLSLMNWNLASNIDANSATDTSSSLSVSPRVFILASSFSSKALMASTFLIAS